MSEPRRTPASYWFTVSGLFALIGLVVLLTGQIKWLAAVAFGAALVFLVLGVTR